MRVIRYLFSALLFLGLIGAGLFFSFREIWLLRATSQIKTEIQQLRSISENAGAYIQQCRTKGITADTLQAIEAIQIRFTSPTEYAVEVVCAQFKLDPIVIETGSLPMFVSKTPGSSGVDWLTGYSGVGLQMWGRTRGVIVEQSSIRDTDISNLSGTSGPVTSCAGHGFTCCQQETSQGVGAQISNVTDCRQTCFESCVARPVVLSFVAQPNFDATTRRLTISSGEPVEMTYVVDTAGADDTTEIVIDYGDGTSDTFNEPTGRATHSYQCNQQQCQYQVVLRAQQTEAEVSSVETPISTMTVVVSN